MWNIMTTWEKKKTGGEDFADIKITSIKNKIQKCPFNCRECCTLQEISYHYVKSKFKFRNADFIT